MFVATVKFWNFDTNTLDKVSATAKTKEKALGLAYIKVKNLGIPSNDIISAE